MAVIKLFWFPDQKSTRVVYSHEWKVMTDVERIKFLQDCIEDLVQTQSNCCEAFIQKLEQLEREEGESNAETKSL